MKSIDVCTISEHLRNIFDSEEIQKEATIRKFRTVQTEGSREVARNVDFYNLDAIISVGYRVNSVRATQFRQEGDWGQASKMLSCSFDDRFQSLHPLGQIRLIPKAIRQATNGGADTSHIPVHQPVGVSTCQLGSLTLRPP